VVYNLTHRKRYLTKREFDKTFLLYLKLNRKDVFSFIEEHNLYDKAKEKIVQLISLDEAAAVKLFSTKPDIINVS
jgi:hypothetical protein